MIAAPAVTTEREAKVPTPYGRSAVSPARRPPPGGMAERIGDDLRHRGIQALLWGAHPERTTT